MKTRTGPGSAIGAPTATFAAVFLVFAALQGCSGSDGVAGTTPADPSDLSSDAFAVIDADDALLAIDDATTDAPMGMHRPFAGGAFHRDHRHPRGHGSHLGRVLRDLQLTDDQLEAIRDLMRDYHDAVRSALEGLHAVNQEILAEANAERRAILALLRNGEIGFAEARDRLRALSEATRDAIRNNPANAPFKAELCEARATLLADVRLLLDPDQQAVWDAWIAEHSTDCAA